MTGGTGGVGNHRVDLAIDNLNLVVFRFWVIGRTYVGDIGRVCRLKN